MPIYKALLEGAKTSSDVALATGLDPRAVGGRLSGLQKQGHVNKNGEGYWAIAQ